VRLLRLFASPSYRPPVLPAVAIDILRLSQRQTVDFDEVVAVLERDPILAAKVLSIAQSAFYAALSPIMSLKQATVRLGMKTVRDLVLEAAMKLRVFRAPGYDAVMERLARHSTTTAYLIRALCRKTAIQADYAFLCGLLHDVGIAACLLALSDEPRGGTIPFETLGSVLHEVHENASGLVTRLWGLPSEIQRVAGSHHHLELGGRPHPVNAALIVAEGFANELGAGMTPAEAVTWNDKLDSSSPDLFASACTALGLDDEGLASARAEAAEIVKNMASPAPAPPAEAAS
jgi:HD-like signal output (HDOD) protein